MLQNTILRLSGIEDLCRPIVICNENHRFLVAGQLREIRIKPDSIILEPVGKNTAPALAIAALKCRMIEDEATLLVLPADHIINDEYAFHKTIWEGAYYADQRKHVTFGIAPNKAETGFGYIKRGNKLNGYEPSTAFAIDSFTEKPGKETAERYLESGDYFWNSGMFIFNPSQVLDDLKIFSPEIVDTCEKALTSGRDDLDFFRLDPETFSSCSADSIDYALMERTERGVVVPLDAGWDDLGSWDALWKVGLKDKNDNVLQGDVIIYDVRNSIIKAESKMVAAVGLNNHVIIETSDAVLVSPRDRVQEVKEIVLQLRDRKREEAIVHKKVYRPWGSYEGIDLSDNFQVKRITVTPGAVLSLQKHYHRAEHWVVVKGTALVTKGKENILLKEDESIYIPLGEVHRLENPGKIPLELIEVQSGSYVGEDDIVRLEDVYGR